MFPVSNTRTANFSFCVYCNFVSKRVRLKRAIWGVKHNICFFLLFFYFESCGGNYTLPSPKSPLSTLGGRGSKSCLLCFTLLLFHTFLDVLSLIFSHPLLLLHLHLQSYLQPPLYLNPLSLYYILHYLFIQTQNHLILHPHSFLLVFHLGNLMWDLTISQLLFTVANFSFTK